MPLHRIQSFCPRRAHMMHIICFIYCLKPLLFVFSFHSFVYCAHENEMDARFFSLGYLLAFIHTLTHAE